MTDRLEYGTTAKVLHWVIAALLLVQYLIGWLMPDIHRGQQPGTAMTLHVSIGMLILILIVLRLAWRLTHPVAPESSLPPWQRMSSEAVHWLLYVLALATTTTGWLFASFRGWSISFFYLVPLPMLASDNAEAGKGDRRLAPGDGMGVAGGHRPARRLCAGPHLRLSRSHHAADVAGVGQRALACSFGHDDNSSLPGLTRQSITSKDKGFLRSWMDARVKPAHDECAYASNMMTLRTVLPAFIAAKPSLISDSFSFAEIQSSRCSLPRM